MQIVIRELDSTLKIDTVSIGSSAGVVTASPFGSSTDNSLATWSGTTGLILHSDRTVTLTTSTFIVPASVTSQFLGAGATSTRIGLGALAAGVSAISVGEGASGVNNGAIALGKNALVNSSNANGIAIGTSSAVSLLGPVMAIGALATASDRGISLGPSCTTANAGLAIGGACHAENSSIAIGNSATTAAFSESVALGSASTATGDGQFQVGSLAFPLTIHAYAGLGVFGHAPPALQPAAIPDASGGGNIDTEARAAINAVLVALRGAGLINT